VPLVIPAAGLSAAGLFVSQLFVDPTKPPGILADAIDPTTGEYLSISKGMDPIDAQMILALSVKRGSGASVTEDGQTFFEIKKIDESTPALIEARTRSSAKRLTDRGDVAFATLTPFADSASQSGSVAVQYRNLRARGPQARTLLVLP
jgi:hypothetical protein